MSDNKDSFKPAKDGRVMHPNSLKNLEIGKFPKGYNGNQQGYSLKSLLLDNLQKPLKAPPKDAPARDLLVHSTIEGAIKRETAPFKEVWDRTEGKVTDTHKFEGEIILRIIDDDSDKGTDNTSP